MKRLSIPVLALGLLMALPTVWSAPGGGSVEKELKSIRKDLKKSNLKSGKKRQAYRKALTHLKELLAEGIEGETGAEALDLYVDAGFRIGEYPDILEAIDEALEEEIADGRREKFLLTKGRSLARLIRFDEAKETLESIADGSNAKDVKKALALLERQRTAKPEVGKPAPDINFRSVDGRMVNLSQLRGRVVLIDFWATWCKPCTAEMPNVIKTYNTYARQGFTIVGISLDSDKSALEAYVKDNEMPWPQFFNEEKGDNALASYYGVTGIPSMFLLDRRGNIASTNARGHKLAPTVKQLLGGR